MSISSLYLAFLTVTVIGVFISFAILRVNSDYVFSSTKKVKK